MSAIRKYSSIITISLFIISVISYFAIKILYIDKLQMQVFSLEANINSIKNDSTLKEKRENLKTLKVILSKIDIDKLPKYVWENVLQKYEENKKIISYYLENGMFGRGITSCSVTGELTPTSLKSIFPEIYMLSLKTSLFYEDTLPYTPFIKILMYLSKKRALLISSIDLMKNRAYITYNILGTLNFINKTTKYYENIKKQRSK